MSTNFKPNVEFIEVLGSMEKGVNYGIAPNLVKNNQLTTAQNLTVRGDYVNPRNPVNKIPITFQNPAIQSGILGGIFQGAGIYNPDSGNTALFASISGRLMQFTISGSVATAVEQTIPEDLNLTGLNQVWMWQSENYLIVNDGTHLPIFFNGASSRRSYGPAVSVGNVTENFAIPAVGSMVNITLSAPYAGPLGDSITIDGFIYQVVSTGSTNTAILTPVQDTIRNVNPPGTPVGSTVTAGATIDSVPSILGVVTISGTLSQPPYPSPWTLTIALTAATVPPIGSVFTIDTVSNITFTVTSVNPGVGQVSFTPTPSNQGIGVSVLVGTVLRYANSTAPTVPLATITQNYVVPSLNSPVTVTIDGTLTVSAGTLLYINNAAYLVTPGTPTGASNTITVENIDDVPGTAPYQNVRGPNAAGIGQTLVGPGAVSSVPELPVGRMGVYGLGRNWMSLADGRSFIASDIVGGSSGSPSLNDRDAVLRISENSFLFEGGVFTIPGSSIGLINAMIFAATLDASLGQGPLQVLTPTTAFSCNAPVDRTTWQSITNPILTESLISNGALGQDFTSQANGDILFRSIDGLRSLILARRDFDTWGNVPQSREVQPILAADNPNLLNWGSLVIFNNRALFTAGPTISPNGIYHPTAIALNFDPLSTLNTKAPCVYDGPWTPFNALKYVTGQFNGVQRCFAFVLNTTNPTANTIEIWEMLGDSSTQVYDNNTNPIVMDFSTGDLFDDDAASKNKSRFDYCQLRDGELYVDQVEGPVTFTVYYKPDQYANWTQWYSWNVNGASPYYARMGLGEPDGSACDPVLNRPLREGYTFQIRIVISGSCRFLGARFKAVSKPQPDFAPQVCNN